MIPPAPSNPQVEQHPNGSSADLPGGAQTTGRVLPTFHVLAVLVAIVLSCI
jgi:hypothetical protein